MSKCLQVLLRHRSRVPHLSNRISLSVYILVSQCHTQQRMPAAHANDRGPHLNLLPVPLLWIGPRSLGTVRIRRPRPGDIGIHCVDRLGVLMPAGNVQSQSVVGLSQLAPCSGAFLACACDAHRTAMHTPCGREVVHSIEPAMPLRGHRSGIVVERVRKQDPAFACVCQVVVFIVSVEIWRGTQASNTGR